MKEIRISEAAAAAIHALSNGGILITAKAHGKLNHMTIGWGTVGIEWGKPVFVTYVRRSRYTRELLDENPEFTVNIPVSSIDPRILRVCGTESGRDTDKTAKAGLTPVDGIAVSVPAVKELPLTLECRAVYRQVQDHTLLEGKYSDRYYPQTDNGYDEHIMYYGEIVKAYIADTE